MTFQNLVKQNDLLARIFSIINYTITAFVFFWFEAQNTERIE